MPRQLKTIQCKLCNCEFSTSSNRFEMCPKCRKKSSNINLINNFFRSSFGRWLNTRISQSGTLKVLGDDFNTDAMSNLYELWSNKRTYSQLYYDATSDQWKAVLDLQLCHIYPLKGPNNHVGELTPRNLLIAPKSLNNHLQNKLFDSGFYVTSKTTLNTKQSKKKLISSYTATIIEFQKNTDLTIMKKTR